VLAPQLRLQLILLSDRRHHVTRPFFTRVKKFNKIARSRLSYPKKYNYIILYSIIYAHNYCSRFLFHGRRKTLWLVFFCDIIILWIYVSQQRTDAIRRDTPTVLFLCSHVRIRRLNWVWEGGDNGCNNNIILSSSFGRATRRCRSIFRRQRVTITVPVLDTHCNNCIAIRNTIGICR